MLITHHKKYKEIHGKDEFVPMEKGEHTKLHKKLRRENKCKIPVKELNIISKKARTRRGKEIKRIDFLESLFPYVRFHESIRYDEITGNLTYTAGFEAMNGKNLLYIGEKK